MEQKLSIPLLRFMYFVGRRRTKKKTIHAIYGGKMSNEEFERCINFLKKNE